MTDPSTPDDPGKGSSNNQDQDGFKKRLDELGQKLDTVNGLREPKPPSNSGSSGFAIAMRMGTEFVVAVLIGGAIGWQLDKWLGTTPLLLFIFILFGFAAGTRNIIRLGNELNAKDSKASDPQAGEGEKK